jgi:hypothetical protein
MVKSAFDYLTFIRTSRISGSKALTRAGEF